MRGSSFGYLLKEGFRNIYANRMLSIAAIGVLMACLLLVGTSMLFTMNVNSMVGYIETQNEVVVFLDDFVDQDAIDRIDGEIGAMDNVASITFVSKEQGLTEWMESLGESGAVLETLLDDNPLQDSFRLVIKDLSRMDETLEQLRGLQDVESVNAPIEVAKAVTGLKQVVSTGGFVIIAILVAVSLMIIANTIRITIFNRRKEISIMKYVGATDSFIRLPFLVEGMLLGLISATLAFLLLWGGYTLFASWIYESQASWAILLSSNLVQFGTVAAKLYLYFVGAGVFIGGFGSMVFMGKYIKV